tara:strand:+ start:2042 stop:3892 length:1851 start_codon:yes stop_codon:yes gene_type:complete
MIIVSKIRMLKKITIFLLLMPLLVAQGLIIKTQHLSQSQGSMTGDSLRLIGAIGASISNLPSGDTLSLDGGFLAAVTGLYRKPPSLRTEITDKIPKEAESVTVQAITQDINGILSANLYVQVGGSDTVIELPMVSLDDSTYQANIPDSLLTVKNFRSWVISVDGMYYDATSNYDTPALVFGENELRMDDSSTSSRFPDGVLENRWRMVSWPAELLNGGLKNSSLENGFVFYDRNPVTNKLTKPDTIITGKAYWFKHHYADNVIFSNHNTDGTAVPLVDYNIPLEEGWNMIGSPFSFPVSVKVKEDVSTPLIYTYGYSDSTEKDGWSKPITTLYPWSGYAVYSDRAKTLTLQPFEDSEDTSRNAGRSVSPEWVLNLKVQSRNYLDYSCLIGRRELGQEGEDALDIPALPSIESFVAVRTEVNGNGDFNYGADIRSLEESNGVWNLRLISDGIVGPYTFSITTQSDVPSGMKFALLDIPNKHVIRNVFSESITINESLGSGYDVIVISGDEQYVDDMIRKIFETIPDNFSLSQNYPNPFNPTTKIDFALPRSADVSITIYNLMGQQVNVLMNSNLEYGYHTVIWNGLDQFGRPVSSGVYFSELRTRNFRQTKKMLLLK